MNNVYRSFIFSSIISDDTYNGAQLDDNTLCYLFAQKLKKLKNIENDLIGGFYEALLSTIYLDAYKYLNLKEKELSITYLEQNVFNDIRFINTLEALEESIDRNPIILDELLSYFLEFYRMNDLRKITAFNALGSAVEYNLKTGYEIFSEDVEEFDDKINLDYIANYATKQKEAITNLEDESIIYDNIFSQVLSFFNSLKRDNFMKYEELIKEVIKLDYEWIKYIRSKNISFDMLIYEDLDYRIALFEENDIRDLAFEAVYDIDYLEQLIDSFLNIKCDNMFIDERFINQEVVDKYYKSIERKLKKERE